MKHGYELHSQLKQLLKSYLNICDMIILLSVIIMIIILLIACYWYQTQSRVAKLINQFPLIAPITPVLGNVELLSNKQEVVFAQFRKFAAKHDETYAGWGAFIPTLHIITSDDAEIILSNINTENIKKGLIYYILRPWLGTGLLTSSGEKWFHRRKMLTQAFHPNVLKSYLEIFGEHSTKLIEKLKAVNNGTPIDISPLIQETILIALCETILGLKLDNIDKKTAEYFDTMNEYIKVVSKLPVRPWLHPKYKLYYLSTSYYQMKKLVQKLRNFTNQIIEERQLDHNLSEVERSDCKSRGKFAMLDLLISAKREMGAINDEGIQEEVDTFVFEGHGTTTAAIYFALLLLAEHENIQQTIIEELDEIFNGSTRPATYEDLQNMKYLERCLKESQRLYPSIPLIVRRLKKDTLLTHHLAPSGTEIFIHIYDIHRDPKYFPNPDKFDPDRFLPENSRGRHPFAYIPFSSGPRNCIGQKFAMLELKSVVSSVLRNFTIESIHPLENLPLTFDFILKVDGPIYMKFKPRS